MTSSRALALVLLLAAASARAQFCPLGETERRIVTCKADVTMGQCLAAARTAGCSVVRSIPLIHAVVIEVPSVRAFAAEAKLNARRDVAAVETDRKVRWLHNVASNDFTVPDLGPIRDQLRKIKENRPAPVAASDPRVPWGVERVGAPQAWSRTQGAGAVVGVIDTGIDAAHPDLQGQVLGGVNILNPQHPETWADDEGHGTHVSGTIAANGKDLLGVAPAAKLYAIKVLDKDGNGNYDDVIAGIEWAMKRGIKIVNMSLGADEGSDALHAAVQAAVKAGVTIVAASGNSGGAVGYPGAYPEVIAVGACDSSDKVAPFSSRGPEVSFIAPGVDILSAKLGGGLTKLSGTSMATPHVAGLAALAYSLGAKSPAALRAVLDRAARPIAGLDPSAEGRGLILAGDLSPNRTDSTRPVMAMLPGSASTNL